MKIGNINIDKPILLAPMEDVTDQAFRIICKRLGADIVYTEFVNAEGLIRKSEKTHKKLKFTAEERPIGIQIYGGKIDSMVESTKLAEEENPDLIDINAGCWVKNVTKHGSGSALLKDIIILEKMVASVVKSTNLPVTVKTRLGWDESSINILEVAKIVESAGAKAITVHCRTRAQAHKGEPDWNWIPRVKEVVNIPVILNGGVLTPPDVKRAFDETNCDAVMIARGAISNPWIFSQAKALLNDQTYSENISLNERIDLCIQHLKLSVELKGEPKGVIEFRKHYSGYLKGFTNASKIRMELMKFVSYDSALDFLLQLKSNISKYECQIEKFSN